MNRNVFVLAVAVSFLLTCSPSSAATQCKPVQINGNWAIYDSISGGWTECLIAVKQSNVLSGQCRQYTFSWFPVIGTIRLSRSCRFNGAIRETGSGSFNELFFGVLQSNGLAGAGVMTDLPGVPINNLGSHFSLVRRP